MIHLVVVFGTRPEGIKMMPIVKALRNRPDRFKVTMVVTGQHREMMEQVFNTFRERPDIDLGLMVRNQTLPEITASVLTNMTSILNKAKPDAVLVHGDTTTAMATAIAAFYAQCRIGHVEAGLRSFDLQRPWPEEFNRVVIDSIATYLFAPTQLAQENLSKEYNGQGNVYVTGNTGIDSLLYVSRLLREDTEISCSLSHRYRFLDQSRRLILVTGHRRESFGEGFQRICDGLAMVAARADTQVLYPVHLNPHVQHVVAQRLSATRNLLLIDPVEYVDMVYLMERAALLLTDSGGIQEEGPALGRPVLVMRDVTERPEAVNAGAVKLIGTDPELMRREVNYLLDNPAAYERAARPVFPYGDGTAAAKILEILESELA